MVGSTQSVVIGSFLADGQI